MNDVSPAHNNADLANTVKEMMARHTTFESQLKAQSEELRTLRVKNENLKKHIKDLDDVKEDYNKLKDDHGQLKERYAYDVTSLKDRIEKLESNLPSPSTSPPPSPPQPPSTLTNVPNPSATPPASQFVPIPSHLSTPHFPRHPLEVRILTCWECFPRVPRLLRYHWRRLVRHDGRSFNDHQRRHHDSLLL